MLYDDGENVDFNKKLQRMMPTQIQDIIATFIFLILLPCGILLHLLYVLPTWYPVMGEAWVIRATCFGVLVFNLYSNWVYMIKTGPNGHHSALPNVIKPGYKHCHSCHSMSPLRAHHCPVCDVCILRRDHHCSFGAVCVGHFNQRYFVAAVINLFIMTLPLVSYSWSLLNIKMTNEIGFGNIWQVVIPHLAWIAGYISIYQFLHVLLFVFTFTVSLFTFYLLTAQVFCIYQGQTRIEFLMDVHAYQLGLLENLRQSLGSRWPFIAISCFIPSPLPTDGLGFVTREMFNLHTKDL